MLEASKAVRKDIMQWFEPAEVDTHSDPSEWWKHGEMLRMSGVQDAVLYIDAKDRGWYESS